MRWFYQLTEVEKDQALLREIAVLVSLLSSDNSKDWVDVADSTLVIDYNFYASVVKTDDVRYTPQARSRMLWNLVALLRKRAETRCASHQFPDFENYKRPAQNFNRQVQEEASGSTTVHIFEEEKICR
jgi:hypothetical protein